MKLNIIPSIIALAASALFAYGIYSWCHYTDLNLLVSIMGGICIALTAGACLGVSLPNSRTSLNVKVLSGVFAAVFIIINVIFCCIESFAAPAYIIINGILLLIWLLGAYFISKA